MADQQLAQMETCCAPLCQTTGTVGTNLVLVKAEDPIKGYKRQVRCNECNNATGRIKRFLADSSEDKSEYTRFGKDTKAKFLQKVSQEGLVGDKLKQVLTETATWCKIQKSTRNFKAEGKFATEKEIRDDPKLEEEDKEAIIANTETIQCKFTGKTLYWKPEYSMGWESKTETLSSKKRELEYEEKLKPNKIIKAPKAPKRELTNGEEEKPKPIPPAQLERLGKVALAATTMADKLAQKIADAKSPDRQGAVAPLVMEQLDKHSKTMEEAISKIEKLTQSTEAKTGISQMRCLLSLRTLPTK